MIYSTDKSKKWVLAIFGEYSNIQIEEEG
jgi:hypothetical protein